VARFQYVDTETGLDAVVAALEGEPRFALDTEFHRERTYWPKVALIQIAWPGGLALIDPLAADVSRLAPVIGSDRLLVAHAASQDLEVLAHCCEVLPKRIFDTQIAAGFVGGGIPSLSALHKRELGVTIAKAHRLTDWLARPLRAPQLEYAAGDVAQLLRIHDRLAARLRKLKRTTWAADEFDTLLRRASRLRRPEDAWSKVKDIRRLRGRSLAVARSLAKWREQRAAVLDRPVRHVMSDMAIVSIAGAKPRNPAELSRVRGVADGVAKGRLGKSILEAVSEGLKSDWRPPKPKPTPRALRSLKPAVGLVMAWVTQVARASGLEPSLLATRADVEALIRGDADARLASGWRAEMVGEPIRQLTSGEASLAFDGDGLALEARSRRPVKTTDRQR